MEKIGENLGTGASIILALPAGFAVLGWHLAIKRKGHRTELIIIVGFNVIFVPVVIDNILTEKYPAFTQLLIWELALAPFIALMASVVALLYRRFKRRTVE